jgi:hypothetical protein
VNVAPKTTTPASSDADPADAPRSSRNCPVRRSRQNQAAPILSGTVLAGPPGRPAPSPWRGFAVDLNVRKVQKVEGAEVGKWYGTDEMRDVRLSDEDDLVRLRFRVASLEWQLARSEANPTRPIATDEMLRLRDPVVEQELSSLRNHIRMLEASTSWRITAPLRFVKRLVRRG